MYVNKIMLQNYRNYDKLSLSLHEGLNIFLGNNAQGKTNLIEAIYMCGTGRSHRTSKDKEIISWEKEWAVVKSEIVRMGINSSIEINIFSNKPKIIKIGGAKINRVSELLGNLNVVMFSPEDLKLVKEGPVFRRRFLDIEISQIKPGYYYNLSQYNKVLLQRNNLLKEIKYDRTLLNTLDIWDEQLAEYGANIINYRNEFVKKISILARLVHRKITDGKEEINISYSTQFKNMKNKQDIKSAMYKEIICSRQKDMARGTTSVGPHRDDIDFFIDNVDVKSFGSQGQQRTSALSLKLAELELMKGECGEYPILLLDDVMSELDIIRQKYLLENLKNIQTMITCTSISDIKDFRKNDRYVFEVCKGIAKKTE